MNFSEYYPENPVRPNDIEADNKCKSTWQTVTHTHIVCFRNSSHIWYNKYIRKKKQSCQQFPYMNINNSISSFEWSNAYTWLTNGKLPIKKSSRFLTVNEIKSWLLHYYDSRWGAGCKLHCDQHKSTTNWK